MKNWFQICGFVALIASSAQAFAWGYQGHEVIGSIADQMLAPNAKQQVGQILGFELRVAAPWADCVRSVRNFNGTFKYSPDPNHPEYRIPCTSFETPDETARMEDYVARNWDNCAHQPNHGCHESYHFTDVAIQRDRYDRAYKGTNDHDIVAAISAAILILQDKPAPAPFSIKDKKEALFLLAHFVGDLHQPLHVGAIYLDANGSPVDPDSPSGYDPNTQTAGGNFIKDGTTTFHVEWDEIPTALGRSADPATLHDAEGVTPTAGSIDTWATKWASDTVIASHTAFTGVSFAGNGPQRWIVNFADRSRYLQTEDMTKRDQIAKAGARLAQLLNSIWP